MPMMLPGVWCGVWMLLGALGRSPMMRGRVVKAVSGVGGTCFDCDGAGRLLARRVAATSEGFATTSYACDAVGNVVSVTDPFGAVTKYAYDGAHRCTEVMNRMVRGCRMHTMVPARWRVCMWLSQVSA